MGFLKSNRIGQNGEQAVKNLLENCNIQCVDAPEKEPTYDFIFSLLKKKYKVEVKFDFMAQKTGNLAIEYYNVKKCAPSGIGITQADIWATCIYEDNHLTIWMVPTKKLKLFIENNQPVKDIVGGDNNAALKIYRQEDILSVYTRMDDIGSCEEFKKRLKQVIKETK